MTVIRRVSTIPHIDQVTIYASNLTSTENTDGANTIYSNNITFTNWEVVNGDDSISTKANSTDITIANSKFTSGLGIAIGSIGQYNGAFETVKGLKISNITYDKTTHAVYFKTWTGDQVGYPPNGGGGGLGCTFHILISNPCDDLNPNLRTDASDIVATNLKTNNLKGAPFTISQCTTFSGASGNCTNSKFQIRDLVFTDISGTVDSAEVASFQCSAVAPCEDITIENVSLRIAGNTTLADEYLCGNVEGAVGWNCTGEVCVGSSATGGC